MAKSKSFFGLRRGSTKSLTFQVLNGRQVTKDRVYDVKNPRTFSQMQQRMVMATAAAAYAGMREIVDHSFEGITYGQPTMSEFIRLNAKMLRDGLIAGDNTLFYNPYGNRQILPNPYIVSKGSLKAPDFSLEDIMGSKVQIFINLSFRVEKNTTVGEFFEELGLTQSGYLTFLTITFNDVTKVSQFGYCRLKPKWEEAGSTVDGKYMTEIFQMESNVQLDDIQILHGNNALSFTFDFDEGGFSFASVAAILSDKKIKWLRSPAKMEVFDNGSATFSAATALATYPVGTDYILNGGTV